MFVIPFASRHAAQASQMVRNVRKAVLTLFFRTEVSWELPRSGNPAFLDFLFPFPGPLQARERTQEQQTHH